MKMRTKKEIDEYKNEATKRMQTLRNQEDIEKSLNLADSINDDELKKIQEELCYVCKEYDIDFYNSVNDWYSGYWTGVLSTLKWVVGGEKDFQET